MFLSNVRRALPILLAASTLLFSSCSDESRSNGLSRP